MRSSDVYEGAAAPSRLSVEGLGVDRIEAGRVACAILSDIQFVLEPGATAAVTGPSGAGKTTLLYAVAGLVRPDRGGVRWGGSDIAAWPERRRDRWRRDAVGLVFQDFQLFPELGVVDNILLPTRFDRVRSPAALRERARALAERVGVAAVTARAGALSRGEQQRVALARAFSHRPAILFADEPTGNLDAATGATVIDLMVELNRELATTLVLVTHDPDLASRAGRILRLRDGAVVPDDAP